MPGESHVGMNTDYRLPTNTQGIRIRPM